jgi:hypothetical protein
MAEVKRNREDAVAAAERELATAEKAAAAAKRKIAALQAGR